MTSLRNLLIMAAIALAAAGCYETPQANMVEPHEYKGARDSQRILHSPQSLKTKLLQRLERGQTDR
ncbi:MAG: hypothetical protein P8126_09080 [Gammaproteobacteria bacterium]|jgi:hypothetical protein